MKLYIKQKVFSWGAKFTVKDEAGNDRYFVEGEVFSFGRKLHVTDTSGKEVAFIQQKVFSFLPRYFVYVDGKEVAEIVKEFSVLRPRYSIEGLGWEINGDFWSHNYMITRNDNPIVTIRKEWMTWGDSYELDISDPRDEKVALAVVLTIDCVMAAQAQAAAT
ncbi:MAG: LURP-one-related family protein [Clostridia bacterium]|nr:LURP-one-related family protein [Clostridia bacterium]